MTLLWKAPLLRGDASLRGNCAKGADDFCVVEVVRAAQAQILPGPILRLENNFHDGQYRNPNTGQVYTEQRAMCDVAQLQIQNGDETWWRVPVMLPADWIGWFPKNDELASWPARGIQGGAIFQIHHAPPVGSNDWSAVVGSAPMYVIATNKEILIEWVDPDAADPITLVPLVSGFTRGQWYEIVLHVKWSPDPAQGFFEAFVDGKQVQPLTRRKTSYAGVSLYPIIGFYRRLFIGDPTLTWPADGSPGIVYPQGFVPKKGARVFPKDDGYPQSVQYKPMAIGTSGEDVTSTPAVGGVDVAKATAGLQALVDTRLQLEKVTLPQYDAAIASLQQRRAELQARRDQIAKVLDAGDWGGGVVAK